MKRRRPRPSRSLLILDCDPAAVDDRAARFGAELETVAQTFAPSARIRRIHASSTAELLRALGEAKEQVGKFHVIAIVGHSNAHVLALSPDRATPWREVGRWLRPFTPAVVVLIACEAGRYSPGAALFEEVPSLRELYGSPVVVDDNQAALLKPLISYLLCGQRVTVNGLRAGQVVTFLLTKGILLRRTRQDYRRSGLIDQLAWAAAEEILKEVVGRTSA